MDQAVHPHRICLVVGQLRRGGLERQAFLLASNLDRQRFDVTVIALSEGGPWAAELGRAGVRVLELRRHGKWDVRRLWTLAGLFRRLRPHVVYSFNYEANAYARFAGLLAGVPILLTGERGIYLKGPQILLERFLHRVTECVVVNAEAIRRDLIGRVGLPSSKVITIRNAAVIPPVDGPAEREAARLALKVPSANIVVVGTIARLHEVKNLGLLLQAAKLTDNARPSIVYRIVGGGPDEDRLRRELRDRGLEDTVTLLGEYPDASSLLAGIHIFVLTSRSEGLPNTIMEAMAAGLPCVCTNVGGCGELVEDGVTGYLVPPGDADVLAARILVLASDAETRRRMGEAGRRKLKDEFSVGRLVSSTESLFRALLAAKDSKARGARLLAGALGREG